MKITNAYIEITNVCNLNCRYCYNSSGTVHARKELSLAQLKHIVSRLTDEFGCAGISLSGGDPTLHSEFEEILAYLLGFPQLDISVVTNGTTGNQALTDAYNAYPNLRIQVSLDGSCEAVNARTRGSGHFSDIAAFLSKLRHPDKSPVIKMVVSSANMTDVEAYYKFAMDNGCVPAFDFVNKSGNAVGDWDDLDISAKQKLSVLSAVERLNHEYGRDVALPYCTSKCPLTLPDAELSVLVKCDGTLQPCQLMYDERFTLGNLLHDDTQFIYDRYSVVSEIAVKRRDTKDEKCRTCLVRENCEKGCMALSVMNHGDALTDDGECTYRKIQTLKFGIKNHEENNDE